MLIFQWALYSVHRVQQHAKQAYNKAEETKGINDIGVTGGFGPWRFRP